MFQSTPPHWGRPVATDGPQSLTISFNPRPRTGGDQDQERALSEGWGFNPRPRTGGDPSILNSWSFAKMFQSTPPHWGRRALHRQLGVPEGVSIHAPALGATNTRSISSSGAYLFQS